MGGWVAGFYKYITNSAQTEVRAGAELGKNSTEVLLRQLHYLMILKSIKKKIFSCIIKLSSPVRHTDR